MSLAFDFTNHGNVLIVHLDGELDHHTADDLRDAIQEKVEALKATNIIVDFTNLTFMDSSGLGVVFGRYKQMKAQGGELIVSEVPTSIFRLFEMSGLFKIIRCEESVSAALESLGVAK